MSTPFRRHDYQIEDGHLRRAKRAWAPAPEEWREPEPEPAPALPLPKRKPVASVPAPAPEPEQIAVNAAPQNYDNIRPVLRPYMRCLVELEAQMRAVRSTGKKLRTSNLDLLSVSALTSDSGNFERAAANGMAQGYDVSSGLFRRRQAIESGELARFVDGSRTAEILKTGKLRELES